MAFIPRDTHEMMMMMMMLGPEALQWWRQLAKQVAESDPLLQGRGKCAVACLLAQWWAETSVALQRANAKALFVLLGDQTAGEGLEEDGEQDDTGLGEQPVVAALLPTEG